MRCQTPRSTPAACTSINTCPAPGTGAATSVTTPLSIEPSASTITAFMSVILCQPSSVENVPRPTATTTPPGSATSTSASNALDRNSP